MVPLLVLGGVALRIDGDMTTKHLASMKKLTVGRPLRLIR